MQASLQSEVRGLQTTIKELYTKFGLRIDSFTAPSWQFPERLGLNVEIGNLLDGRDDRVFLLEMLVDRLLLMLQMCVWISEKENSRSSLPLTISSTVKRFCRGYLKQVSKYQEQEKQIETLKQQLLTAQQRLSEYEECCDFYKGTVETASRPTSIRPSSECSLLTSDVQEPSPKIHIPCSTKDVMIQTVETAFSSCVQCNDKLYAMLDIAQTIGTMCERLCGTSYTLDTNWRILVDVGKFNMRRFMEAIETDVNKIANQYISLKTENETQGAGILSQLSVISQLEVQCKTLSNEIDTMRCVLHDTQNKCKREMKEKEDDFLTQLREVENNLKKEIIKYDKLREEVTFLKNQEAEMKITQTRQDKELQSVSETLQSSRGVETQLKTIQFELKDQLSVVNSKYENTCCELEEKNIELKKTTSHLHALEKRCKSLQSKQTKLLVHIDELDQQCGELNIQLTKLVEEKEEIEKVLQETKERCVRTEECLEKQKQELSQVLQEKDIVENKSLDLERHLTTLQYKLEEERHNTQLLMDYPYTDSHLLKRSESKHYINANTVRIMMLEEQNTVLRQQYITDAIENEECHETYFEVTHPIRLWQSLEDLKETNKADEITKTTISQQTRSQSSGMSMKQFPGRLGDLVNALACANDTLPLTISDNNQLDYNSDSSYENLETFSCVDCDRMFTSQIDLKQHSSSCNTI